MKWKVVALLVVLHVVYLLIGAAIFIAIEGPREKTACKTTLTILEEIKKNLTETKTIYSEDDWKKIVKVIKESRFNGVVFDSSFVATCANNWEFDKAFLFASTIITTIGYGHISPQTAGGQLFCIFYAMLGIPLFGTMITGIGGKCAKRIRKFESKLKHGTTVFKPISNDRLRYWLLIFSSTLITVVFFSVIPAVIFSVIEAWDFREAYYFTFITLTTIGFGDYVAGQNPEILYSVVYRVAVFFWTLLGLACMATVISQLTKSAQKAGARIQALREANSKQDVIENNDLHSSEESLTYEQTEACEPDADSIVSV